MGVVQKSVGKRFGRLVALSVDEDKPQNVICKCDCGTVKSIRVDALRSGSTESCGCLRLDMISYKAMLRSQGEKTESKPKWLKTTKCMVCDINEKEPGSHKCNECIEDKVEEMREYHKDYKKKTVESGKCTNCTNPNIPGFVYCSECYDGFLEAAKVARNKLKIEVMDAYGGVFCCGCGETDIEILTIDHINQDGARQRRRDTGGQGGSATYRWLKKNKYPLGYRVLCFNCNICVYRVGRFATPKVIYNNVEKESYKLCCGFLTSEFMLYL